MKMMTVRRGRDLRMHIKANGPIYGSVELARVCGMKPSRAGQWARSHGPKFGLVIGQGMRGKSRVNVYDLDPDFDESTIPTPGKSLTDQAVKEIPTVLLSGAKTVAELSAIVGKSNNPVQQALYRLRDAGVVVREMETYGEYGSKRYRYRLTDEFSASAHVPDCGGSQASSHPGPGATPVGDSGHKMPSGVEDIRAKAAAWIDEHGGVDAESLAHANGWNKTDVEKALPYMWSLGTRQRFRRARVFHVDQFWWVWVPRGIGSEARARSYVRDYLCAHDSAGAGGGVVSDVGRVGARNWQPNDATAYRREWITSIKTMDVSDGKCSVTMNLDWGVMALPTDDNDTPSLEIAVPRLTAAALIAGNVKVTLIVEPVNAVD